MLIKIGEFDCTECWDGVFYKKLASLIQDALIEYAEDRNISYDTNLAKDYAKYMVNQIAR